MPSAARVTLFTVGGAVLAFGVGSVAITGLVLLSSHDVKANERFEFAGDHLTITSDGGGVHLRTGAAGVVAVDRTVTESIWGADPEWDLDQSESKLRLDTNCPVMYSVNCDGDYKVTIPAEVKSVTVRNSNGSVTVDEMQVDAFDLESDNGSIKVRDSSVTGLLKMSSDNGSINVDRSLADRIDASSDNGSMKLTLRNEPSAVKASSDNGSLRLTLPTGDRNYKLTADSDNGSKNVQDFENQLAVPDSPYTINLSSDNGSLRGYIVPDQAAPWPPAGGAAVPAP
ncbi:DUF4097 family beta strand repeat-containing protein [Yinghuangia sp. YIM S09857]|uniref:DUF4097 family beta strand repeat-containing protein n=1 Tax=Yinghuangia sp. YIM S09857 TaxID=3436929 RepID=UPI003F52C732